MSHAEEDFLSVPSHLTLTPRSDDSSADGFIRLPFLGRGTVGVAIAKRQPFSVGIRSKAWGRPAFRWNVTDKRQRSEHA